MVEPTQTRHGFLTRLHELLRPATYLEIGVQHGWSLQLAQPPTLAIGVDPQPLCRASDMPATCSIYPVTSDHFFATPELHPASLVDLAFIDGMHLFEYALRDFIGVERLSHPGTVVVFDDVLPRNQEEASRAQCPGDWTGDVWKIHPILRGYRRDLQMALVDTFPTGLLLVYGLDLFNHTLSDRYDEIVAPPALRDDEPVPEEVLHRTLAYPAGQVLEMVTAWRRVRSGGDGT